MPTHIFIVGAMKSATTSLCTAIGDHPEVCVAREKESMYFAREPKWSQGVEPYMDLYRHRTNESFLLEASTEYSKLPWATGVPDRLHEFAPDAKIIYIMRDPFQRIVSQYRHQVRAGVESRPFDEALRAPSDYLSLSYYAYQIEPYLERYGPDAVFCTTYERFIDDGHQVCGDIFRWLGLDDDYRSTRVGEQANASPENLELLDSGDIRVRVWRRLKSSRRLSAAIPTPVRAWVKGLLPKQSVSVRDEEVQKRIETTRDELMPIMQLWTHELAVLLGRTFDEWRTPATEPAPDDLRRALETFPLHPDIMARSRA